MKLGIAITTLSRRRHLRRLIDALSRLTLTAYDLIVCDDGSTDSTLAMLATSGVRVVAGRSRGVAWNKNRGLFALMTFSQAEVILLLDDDVMPTEAGWEQPWIDVALRYGHVNLAHPQMASSLVHVGRTPSEPSLSGFVTGACIASSRAALCGVGYMDTRFGRYGLEHVEFSRRFLRAGFGGAVHISGNGTSSSYFMVLSSGMRLVDTISNGSKIEHDKNAPIHEALLSEPIYRHAWRTDCEREIFLAEVRALAPSARPPRRLPADFGERGDNNPNVEAGIVHPVARFLLTEFE
jgi:glycosyltransferase involved in cell wall biosynthesis